MTNRFIYIVLLLGAFLGACGSGVTLDEAQKKKLNDKAKDEMNQTIDKWLTSLGQEVPPDQCKGASICTGTDGQKIECPDNCADSCNGTCNKPSRKKKFEISINADVGGKLGQISASFTTNIDLETLDHKKATHNHKTVSDKKGKDPGKWVNWYMTFRGKVEILGDVKVTTQTGQTITVKLTFVDDNYDFSRCGFADCGGECGPTPSPTPSPTQSPTPPPASPTPMPTQSPTPPPASPTPMPTQSPTPPPPSPTPMASASPTPWPTYSPTPWPTYSPTPWPTYSPTPYATVSL